MSEHTLLLLIFVVLTALLVAFVVVCIAIFWQLRKARFEANARGELGKDLLEEELNVALLQEEDLRQMRKAVAEK
jgi:hypothetical protein